MKIDTLEMYKNYKTNNVENKSALKELINNYNKTKEYYLSKLEDYKHFILNFTNIDYDSIPNLKSFIPTDAIKSSVSFAGLNINYLKLIIQNIVQINKEIHKAENELEICKNYIKRQKIFTEIIYKFNSKISDEILYTGYNYKPGFGLGGFRIKKVKTDKRVKKTINWKESLLKRQEILAEGKLPYKVLERNEDNTIKQDNGGEKWFVYHIHENGVDYIWNWGKTSATAINVPYYRFKPTLYNNEKNGGKIGNINKLRQMTASNSEYLLNFSE